MEAAGASETLVTTYEATRRHTQKDYSQNFQRHKGHNSRMVPVFKTTWQIRVFETSKRKDFLKVGLCYS
jgi:hypothetical protein